ncbi:glycosyltransferase [Microvirga terricola]|uniref:Glycosyltransferase family 4 protein n=1 Tax=Microvirga terricola TaxID=2719797 RepID=A0ABX0VAX5_9HYPH|nr:glycosyltransferase [Microvirga terricola]NIX76822.1 glycosyltransferase family 4 protein [Microvirga terricola]
MNADRRQAQIEQLNDTDPAPQSGVLGLSDSDTSSTIASAHGVRGAADSALQEREQLMRRLEIAEAERDDLARQLDAIMTSRSWQLTSSLRAGLASYATSRARLKIALQRAWTSVRNPSLPKFRDIFIERYQSTALASNLKRLSRTADTIKEFVVPALRAPRSVAPADDAAPLILMIVFSDLRVDPRVMREARVLANAGFRVKIVYPDAMSTPEAPVVLDYGPGVEFRPLPPSAMSYLGVPPYLMGHEFLEAICEERPFAIHSHDLSTALIGLAAAGRLQVPCVCDFHEWYSENVSWDHEKAAYVQHPRPIKIAYRRVERLAMARAAAVVTVCESIASELESNFSFGRKKVHVIRNIPSSGQAPSREYASLREELNLPADKMLVLWQGGTGPSRLLEPVIESLGHYEHFVLVIRGPSLDIFGDAYREIAARAGAPDRLILLPPVPSRDVVAAAKGADCGVWTLPNLCKNFSYALPNKVFEYLYSGLPILAADYPEVRRLVDGSQVGLLFDPYDPQSIAQAVKRLHEEKGLAESMRARMPELIAELDADREWQKLVTLYQTLAKQGSTKSLRAMGRV